MVTPAATFTPGPYAIERLSRLWSVALPAIVITCLLDALSYKLNPAYYSLHWGPYRYIGLHLIANTLFLTQNWGMDIAPLSNSPFWSLSYEAWFYLIFGLSMARRTLWVAIAAILAGPNIMYMMILWLTGVVSFDIFDRLRERRHLIATAAASALLALLLLTIYLRKFEAIGLIYDRLQRGIFGTFHISPRRSREDLIIPGLIAAPMFMAMLCTAKLVGRVVTIPPPVVRISRAAGFSLSRSTFCTFRYWCFAARLGSTILPPSSSSSSSCLASAVWSPLSHLPHRSSKPSSRRS